MSVRPILDRFQATPWVARTPVDDTTVGEILPAQVQVAVRGEGPMSRRDLVPLTPAAHELLYGPHRDGAERVLRGVLGTLDGREGASNLRGLSLSTDDAAFATNLLMSNVEAGFLPDTVAAGDRAGFERDFSALVPSVRVAKAQNTGWIDLGPRVSSLLRSVVEHGPAAGRAAAEEVAMTFAHELQHSITPPDPKTIDDRHVWLEEGIAETLAWWPGIAGDMLRRMGVPPRAGMDPDRATADPATVASAEYRGRHLAVLGLLGLAGVEQRTADGTPDPVGRERAHALLQGDEVERVPRALARAIADRHGIRRPEDRAALAELVGDVGGRPERVDQLRTLVEQLAD